MKLRHLVAAAFLALSVPAAAQAPPQAPPLASIAGVLSFNVTNASSQQALPASTGSFPALTFYNRGTKDAYFKAGPNSSVVATTTPSGIAAGKIPAGTRLTVWAGSGNTNLALITAGADTTTVEVYQSTGPMDFGQIGGSSGGGAVTSVFTRTGDVVATSGDYTCAQVTNSPCLNTSNVYSAASAASTPAARYTGAIFTGGTGITNTPHILIQPSTAGNVTTWSGNGTAIGVNTASGYTGFFLDFRVNGGTSSLFNVSSTGLATAAGGVTIGSGSALKLGNAFVATPATPTGTLLVTDSAGAIYKIPACLASGC